MYGMKRVLYKYGIIIFTSTWVEDPNYTFKSTYMQLVQSFKHIYFSSIVISVLVIYLNHFRVRFLEPTSTGNI